jgi:hypothetical protein
MSCVDSIYGGQLVAINARITEDQKSKFKWHRTVCRSIAFIRRCIAHSDSIATTNDFRRRKKISREKAINECKLPGLYMDRFRSGHCPTRTQETSGEVFLPALVLGHDDWVSEMFRDLDRNSVKMEPNEFFDEYICHGCDTYYTIGNPMVDWEEQFRYVTSTYYFLYEMLGDDYLNNSRLEFFLQSIQVIFRFIQDKVTAIQELLTCPPSPTRTASLHFESDATDED